MTARPDREFYGGNFRCLGETCREYRFLGPMMTTLFEDLANLD